MNSKASAITLKYSVSFSNLSNPSFFNGLLKNNLNKKKHTKKVTKINIADLKSTMKTKVVINTNKIKFEIKVKNGLM